MGAESFGDGLLQGYAFVDSIFERRRQRELDQRRLDLAERQDKRVQQQFDIEVANSKRQRGIALRQEASQLYDAATAQYGEDEKLWPANIAKAIEDRLDASDVELGSQAQDYAGRYGFEAASANPAVAAFQRSRREKGQAFDDLMATSAPAPQQAQPAAAPRVAPAGAPPRRRAVADLSISPETAAMIPSPTQAFADLRAQQQAAAVNEATAPAATKPPSKYESERAEEVWGQIVSGKPRFPGDEQFKRANLPAAVPQYLRQRDALSPQTREKSDVLMADAAIEHINSLVAERDKLTQNSVAQAGPRRGQPVPPDETKLKKIDAAIGRANSFLRDVAGKSSVSKSLGLGNRAPASPQLAQAVIEAPGPRAVPTPARLRADTRRITEVGPPTQPETGVSAAAARGMSAGQNATATVVRKQLSKEQIDATRRLFMAGVITPDQTRHYLTYGTFDDVTTFEQIKNYDPTKPYVVRENGKIKSIIPASPAALRGGSAGSASMLRALMTARKDFLKRADQNGKDNEKFIENWASSAKVRLGKKEDFTEDQLVNGVWATFNDTTVQQILGQKNIRLTDDDGAVSLNNISRAQMATLLNAYEKYWTAKNEADDSGIFGFFKDEQPEVGAAFAGISRGSVAGGQTLREMAAASGRFTPDEIDEIDWDAVAEESQLGIED